MAADTGVIWPWLYQPGPQVSDELYAAQKELIEDEVDLTEIDFTQDEYQSKISGCVSYMSGGLVETPAGDADDCIEVDYKEQLIKLPAFVMALLSLDSNIKVSHIRYVSVIGGLLQDVDCSDRVVLLSVWSTQGKDIINVYLRTQSIRESLILTNSVTKLLYEASGKSPVRLNKFLPVHTGVVLVASCTIEERDAREKLESENSKEKVAKEVLPNGENGSLETDSVKETLKPLEEREMFFILDEESLCLFDHPLSAKPAFDFRFYKESVKNAIDIIYVCTATGQLEIENQMEVFYVKSSKKETEDENFKKLSKVLRNGTIKPKPQEIFSDLKNFVKFFNAKTNQVDNGTLPKTEIPTNIPASHPPAATHPPQQETPSWLTALWTGSHLQNSDEDLQAMWFSKQHEIEICLKESNIPDASNELAAMDPNNHDELRTVIEQIRDGLFTPAYPNAISLIRDCKMIYGETLLKQVLDLDEVELLKRIFFIVD